MATIRASMNLWNLLSGNPPFGPCVVGLGTFDGVHLGHRSLIGAMIHRARELGLPAVVFTFDHSPRSIIDPDNFLGEISSPEEKFHLLRATGVDWVVFRPFEPQFANTPPDAFIYEILIQKLQARAVFVGFNFAFGLHRQGSAQSLADALERRGVDCVIHPRVTQGDSTISSTLIRHKIAAGEIPAATELLGHPVAVTGVVVHGDKRGRTLGFPTANLDLEGLRQVLPPRGVYSSQVDTGTGSYPAVVNIGVRPTFGKSKLLLEAHLLNFTGDLYSRTIRVRFISRMRNERRFDSPVDLIRQLEEDRRAVLKGDTLPLFS